MREARQRVRQSRRSSLAGPVAVGLAFACLVVTGLVGIDFGYHWDEGVQLDLVNDSIDSGTFLPSGFYDWPPVTYLLSVLAVLPDVLGSISSGDLLDRDDFLLPARRVFLVISALGGIWLYLALRRRVGTLGAIAGGACYLLSFQLAYHARWIAPDALLASFTALFILALIIAWDAPDGSWKVYAPAAVAGLATATKYQGAVLVVGALLGVALRPGPRRGWRAVLPRLTRHAALALVVFLALTPGAVVDAGEFRDDLQSVDEHYRTRHISYAGTAPYDVRSAETYLRRMIEYVGGSLPSTSLPLSIAVTGVAVVGVVALVWTDRRFALVLLVAPAVIALSFLRLNVLIVRNLLVFLPFLAVLVGFGVDTLWRLGRRRVAHVALALAVGLVAAWNAGELVRAAVSVADRGRDTTATATARWIEDRPGEDVVLSAGVRDLLRSERVAVPGNSSSPGSGDWLAVRAREVGARPGLDLARWPASRRDFYETIGPREVDFNFYPTWAGDDRVLVFSAEEVRTLRLPWDWD